MLCGYLGLSTDMSALDWVTAVPLTLGQAIKLIISLFYILNSFGRLYYIGLYEQRETSTPRVLFDVEYFSKVKPSPAKGQ